MNYLHYARLAEESYHRKDFEVNDIEMLVIDKSTVVFRGTDEWKDIVTDLRFTPWYTKELGLHPFGITKVANEVTESISKELDITKPLTLIGHSLGGAIALRGAENLIKKGFKIELIIVFGCPRVGRLKELDDIEIIFVKDSNDVVTMIPAFRHCRKQTKIGSRWSWRIVEDHFIRNYLEVLPGE